ncbi:YhcN/YlaJ family sporulation lipoprotein [Lysinibacillus macroides]|uniref:YhcN/YlaJ family sporulation lipoprotein n=1 Tax=Lysinibacillus macroides TaxID=33935 RepID=UPI000ABD9353|nr:YhcN/YlaJ family sporulation lipoprotein [Lysinibacillus macroides]
MRLLGITLPLLAVLMLLNGCAEKEKFIVYGSPQNEGEVEALIKEEDFVDRTTVIQYDDSMLVAVQIKPWDKWKKAKLEKKLQKKFDKKYPNKDVFVSADYKIFYEANKIKKDQIEDNKLSDKITELIKLAKEET